MTTATPQHRDHAALGRRGTSGALAVRRCAVYAASSLTTVALVFGSGRAVADPTTAEALFEPDVVLSTLLASPIVSSSSVGVATPGGEDRKADDPSDRSGVEVVQPVVEPVIDDVRSPERPVSEQVFDEVRPLSRPVVVLYGDSLAWEAQAAFAQAFADRPDVQVVMRTFGGTAICDWLDEMAADVATLAPGIVVIEFVGNNFTPCMQDAAGQPLTGDDFLDRYAADVEAVIATFVPTGAQVVLAAAPISRAAAEPGQSDEERLTGLYARMGRIHDGVRFADAGAAVLDDGHWTTTLPCLPFEPCSGELDTAGNEVNVVRAPDGIHFCPASEDAVRGVTAACPEWSSGAFRFGRALAAPVIESLLPA